MHVLLTACPVHSLYTGFMLLPTMKYQCVILLKYLSRFQVHKKQHIHQATDSPVYCLIGLYSAFIAGTFAMPVPVLCGIISALMHYFFLATFLWMASLAIHTFRSIVQPFKKPIESYHGLSAVICWGMLN